MTPLARLLGPRPRAAAPLPRPADVPLAVVVPLYNHARYIAAALDSVLVQTAPPAEIVVIDDGSEDGGAVIAERVLRHVPGARVLRQDNHGAHAALNRAIGLCRGELVAVLNSDDQFLPHKLAYCQEKVVATPRPALIAGRVALCDASGRRLERGLAADWLRRAHDFLERSSLPQLALLNENFVATTSNMVFTRALWEQVGGFAPLRYCHDLDFLMQAFAAGPVMLDERAHVLYRVHDANTIGEDVHAVRLELAAVIAETIAQAPTSLLPRDDAPGFAAFEEFLRNKAVSDLVLYFLTLRRRFADRHAFYRHLLAEPGRARFLGMLRGGAC
jgi:glycosyltransferase involved in cell wall biosynthesis